MSKRNIVGLIVGLAVAIPTLFLEQINWTAGGIVAPFAFPGMIISMAFSGNVHDFSLWLAAIANAIAYYLLVRIIWWIIDLFKQKAQN